MWIDRTLTKMYENIQTGGFKPRPTGLPMGPNQSSGGIGTHPSVHNIPDIHGIADGEGFHVRLLAGMGSDVRFLTNRSGDPITFEKDRALHIVERVREWNRCPVRSEERRAIENELREICGWSPVDDSVHGSDGE